MAVVVDKTQFSSAQMSESARTATRCSSTTDRGELIIAKLDPQGYHEISRTKVITTNLAAWTTQGHRAYPA